MAKSHRWRKRRKKAEKGEVEDLSKNLWSWA